MWFLISSLFFFFLRVCSQAGRGADAADAGTGRLHFGACRRPVQARHVQILSDLNEHALLSKKKKKRTEKKDEHSKRSESVFTQRKNATQQRQKKLASLANFFIF
jgi:hypothetical protein